MKEPTDKSLTDSSIVQLIPNMMTIAAICAGISAIRFGVQGNFTLAVQLIVVACVLDGLDGRVARLLNSDSKMGAELDSLADFVNFGVAPPLVIYFWALQDIRNAAWISVLIYAICCVLRLARFNVSNKSDDEVSQYNYFIGVPSPAGALIALLPIYVTFGFPAAPQLPELAICAYLVLVGLAMISNVPIWSFKTTRVSRKNVKFFLLGFACIGAAVLTYAWITMVALCVGYIGMVTWSVLAKLRSKPGQRT